MAYKVFLDSNVVFSSLFSRSGSPRRIVDLGHLGTIDLLICPLVEDEVRGVLNRKAPHLAVEFARMLDKARFVLAPNPSREVLRQAQASVAYLPDAAILGAALEAGADFLVTGTCDTCCWVRPSA